MKACICSCLCTSFYRHAKTAENACLSIERHAKTDAHACLHIERHAKTAENACLSVERHANKYEIACLTIEKHAETAVNACRQRYANPIRKCLSLHTNTCHSKFSTGQRVGRLVVALS